MVEKKILYLTFDQVRVSVTEKKTVAVLLDAPSEETGIAPHLVPGIELTPDEARRLAHSLLRTADAAEAVPPRI